MDRYELRRLDYSLTEDHVETALQASWANDHPRTVTEAELYELAGTRRHGLLADLLRAKENILTSSQDKAGRFHLCRDLSAPFNQPS